MPDYSKGKIYIIRSYQTDNVYIGSTTQTLAQRLGKHRRALKLYNKGEKRCYITSCEITQYNDHYIELIKNFPCDCREELQKKEGKYIRKFIKKGICANNRIAGRTNKQYRKDNKEQIKIKKKQYYEDNKENIKQYYKQYYIDNIEKIKDKKSEYRKKNKEQIKQRKAVKITCECGSTVRRNDYARHKKSIKHKKWEENNK